MASEIFLRCVGDLGARGLPLGLSIVFHMLTLLNHSSSSISSIFLNESHCSSSSPRNPFLEASVIKFCQWRQQITCTVIFCLTPRSILTLVSSLHHGTCEISFFKKKLHQETKMKTFSWHIYRSVENDKAEHSPMSMLLKFVLEKHHLLWEKIKQQ